MRHVSLLALLLPLLSIPTLVGCEKAQAPKPDTKVETTKAKPEAPEAAPEPPPEPNGDANVQSKDAIKAWLTKPETAKAVLEHVEFMEQESCTLPKAVTKAQFVSDILAAMAANIDSVWAEQEIEDAGEPLYKLGKYGQNYGAVEEKYSNADPDWEGRALCFDGEPLGEALDEAWTATH